MNSFNCLQISKSFHYKHWGYISFIYQDNVYQPHLYDWVECWFVVDWLISWWLHPWSHYGITCNDTVNIYKQYTHLYYIIIYQYVCFLVCMYVCASLSALHVTNWNFACDFTVTQGCFIALHIFKIYPTCTVNTQSILAILSTQKKHHVNI